MTYPDPNSPPPPPPASSLPPPPPPPPPPYCGRPPHLADANQKKILAGILGIILGKLGIHKFILGYNTAGIITILITLTCVGAPIMALIGLVEGIIYLTKSDEEFYNTYIANKKEWF